ncbi:MAG: Mut7-C ubiquitin/RNAse domain-containing protein [Candidatus Bipolaricaulota bacterium]|nr:Mut7-C ubiquitin/RNAse domain-containing protein [Candidatus Bipolaricaulota bacterium]MCS7273989.1 Mut7-C ubiquitin/RNAse domain-containing protein [Candidatus Bipolaricaulota bacterium]MDW8111342.1 Mut7-C RNAse domain-containing protein [Candidatus Bipolaricaulota bacterium]MDW8329238.1 Mut7-C RNAse domain-containing protein [Candidatus Bipolaricaulota bacterium]
MSTAVFRFYGELNDFLPPKHRQRDIEYSFGNAPAVKDAIEALGVPHTEVDLIVVNGQSVGFSHRLRDGDRVAVYPVFESLDISPIVQLREKPLRQIAFVADVHLGKLARLLRLLGFDTLHSNEYDDSELVALAARERRIVLTRDRGLLKHNAVTHGYWLRSTDPVQQAREVLRRFHLETLIAPFQRCLVCNGQLVSVEKHQILERLPPNVAATHDEYLLCTSCHRFYWRGTHYPRLEAQIAKILQEPL